MCGDTGDQVPSGLALSHTESTRWLKGHCGSESFPGRFVAKQWPVWRRKLDEWLSGVAKICEFSTNRSPADVSRFSGVLRNPPIDGEQREPSTACTFSGLWEFLSACRWSPGFSLSPTAQEPRRGSIPAMIQSQPEGWTPAGLQPQGWTPTVAPSTGVTRTWQI